MPDLSRESPILSAGLISAGLADLALGPAGAGAEVGVGQVGAGVQRRSVQRLWERGWHMRAQTTVTRPTATATMGHMRAMGPMPRRHMGQITDQCRHLHRMDHMQM